MRGGRRFTQGEAPGALARRQALHPGGSAWSLCEAADAPGLSGAPGSSGCPGLSGTWSPCEKQHRAEGLSEPACLVKHGAADKKLVRAAQGAG